MFPLQSIQKKMILLPKTPNNLINPSSDNIPTTPNNPINPSSDKIPVICLNRDFWDAWD
ncbi:MAG TPA: hypothetical protein PK209_09660 [Saprospiraceae bacterium]|nr:hypothetical protein [Saprospiraceae bacterium]